MGYPLGLLKTFIDGKERKFDSLILREAQKVALNAVIKETERNPDLPRDIARRRDYTFALGEELSFHTMGAFDVHLNPDRLTLGYEERQLREFRGTRVRGFYNRLASKVSDEITEYLDNLPF